MKKFLKLLVVMFMFVAMPVFASPNDLFRADDNVSIDEPLNGTAFAAGNNVDVDSKVDGMLFAAGNNVTTAGESDYAFVAGNILKLNNQSFKDGFVAGNSIEFSEVNIERDAYVAGTAITFDGTIGRNAYMAGTTVTIKGKISGNLTAYAENIIIEDGAIITGTLKYAKDSKLQMRDSATIGNKVQEDISIKNGSFTIKTDFATKLAAKFFSLINMLVIALIFMLLFPKLFEKIEKEDAKSILSKLGFGLLTLLVAPLFAIILMVTVVGVSTGLIMLNVYIVSIYLSKMFTGYYISNLLLKDKVKNKYLVLLIGICGLTVAKIIPFIGILVSICSLFIGLGLVVTLIFKRK